MEAEPSVIDDRPVRSSDDKQQMAGYLSISTCQPISVRRDNENLVCPKKKNKNSSPAQTIRQEMMELKGSLFIKFFYFEPKVGACPPSLPPGQV